MLGKKVATLVNGAQPAGGYKVDLDATKFVSGVYIYRLSTPERMLSKKMILLK
jgi:hypothetical protein